MLKGMLTPTLWVYTIVCLEASAAAVEVNVALRKEAYMRSKWSEALEAARGCDGDDTSFASCDGKQGAPWWMVDLGGHFSIGRVFFKADASKNHLDLVMSEHFDRNMNLQEFSTIWFTRGHTSILLDLNKSISFEPKKVYQFVGLKTVGDLQIISLASVSCKCLQKQLQKLK